MELAWKSSLKSLGLKYMPPNPAVREMAQGGLIDDTELWFEFVEARNKSSHTYQDNVANEVYNVAKKFLPEGLRLLETLKIR